jgi:nucleoside-diphosphate-sugar epimerase
LLLADKHTVFAIAHSPDSANSLTAGVEPVVADVVDPAAVQAAVKRTLPEVIINELTALPKQYTTQAMQAAAPRDREVRLSGHANLLSAAEAFHVKRYVLQSSAFWYAPGSGLATEEDLFAFDASPSIAKGSRTYAELETRLFAHSGLQPIALRYGFFYGPRTWFSKEGDVGQQVRQRQLPIIGAGSGMWSWVHVDDAAAATVAALAASPGTYNVVDDDPLPQNLWLPAFARYAGAPEPPVVSEEDALNLAGPDAVYYANRLRGASNAKARQELGFRPRHLEWLSSAATS